MKILKIEAFAGMSGDMFLGALAELADAHEALKELPARLGLQAEAEVAISEVSKNGIACRHVKIIDKNHSHRHDHSPGHSHDHTHEHGHTHAHSHDHYHVHSHPHHGAHRHLKDINRLIDRGDLPEKTKQVAKEIFLKLGEAEAAVHGIPLEKIHFHEVGAIDSIMDIVGAAWLIDRLDIGTAYSTPVTTGFGFALTEHGKLPIPCPATQRLLLGMPTHSGEERGELTTPTGAAILRYLNPSFRMPTLTEERIGYGPGQKDLEIPNVLRLSLCREEADTDRVAVIEANMDDISGEWLGQEFQAQLLDTGALDFYMQQVIMKKGRPGVILTVLTRAGQREAVCEFILEHTTTIGLRYYEANRWELPRKTEEITLSGGTIRVKAVTLPDGSTRIKPESADLYELARKTKRKTIEIQREIEEAWKDRSK